nr:hypothetical protein [Photobacterium sanctipauli]
MAAEKLTKGRLIQILILMAVLITAFVWRTVTYEAPSTTNTDATECVLNAKECLVEDGSGTLNISLNPFPAAANTELTLQIDNTDVKPSATVEGVDMYMGIIPISFEKSASGWVGKFIVPECMHDEMTWKISIEQDDKTVFASFTVKK